MKKQNLSPLLFPSLLLAGLLAYYIRYFDYLEIPSADYIGNFRVFVESFLTGGFQAVPSKLLPAYPLLLSAFHSIMPETGFDPIYSSALLLNFSMLLPYLIIVYIVYRKLLKPDYAFFAMLFLGVNIYTLYSGINAELEIFLSLISVLSIYLIGRHSRWAVATSCITSLVKWDAVFIIPALAFQYLKRTGKFLRFILIGGIPALPLLAWMAFTILRKSAGSNAYVDEIARRGPNIYRYFIDCLLVTSGFLQWLGLDIYYGRSHLETAILALLALAFGLLVIYLLVRGIRYFLALDTDIKLPLLIYLGGFLLIHMVYQNTKDRYVIPILWILNLFVFLGIQGRLADIFSRLKQYAGGSMARQVLLLLPLAVFYIQSTILLLERKELWLLLFSLFLHLLVFSYFRTGTSASMKKAIFSTLAICMLCNFNISYGRNTLDHHGLRRIEFKTAAIWFRENALPGDRILMTETNIAKYFTGMDSSRITGTGSLKSVNIESLVKELKEKKITHILIDDFYIRRLLINDPNAISKKAPLMKELRDRAPGMPSMKLVKKTTSINGLTSYIYRFEP